MRLMQILLHKRKGDAVCCYGKGQYLLLLMNTDPDGCAEVAKRIEKGFGGAVKGCRLSFQAAFI